MLLNASIMALAGVALILGAFALVGKALHLRFTDWRGNDLD
jgi:hypothetical protein